MSAVRASELEECMTILFWREKCLANLALKLTFGTIVLVEIDLRCIASFLPDLISCYLQDSIIAVFKECLK